MLRLLLRYAIRKFEQRHRYDATYLHEIAQASPSAMLKFVLGQPMNLHANGVAKNAWHAARIAAARHEDCGPCTQLTVDMAAADGVAAGTLRAIVARDFASMPVDAALGVRFAEATLARVDASALRDEVLSRYGAPGLVSLSFAISVARIYPTMKRAMGHAHTCERVQVAGEPVIAARAAV